LIFALAVMTVVRL